MLKKPSLMFILAASFLCGACDEAEEAPMDVTVRFAASFGDAGFDCGRAATGLGVDSGDLTPTMFRIFVHDVELIDGDGEATALALTEDEAWQRGGVALLDFGGDGCEGGAAERRMTLEGSAPEGTYVGLRFKVGVPFEANHADPASATGPLSYTSMHWGWQAGYKFMRLDTVRSDGGGFLVHLGSTGCEGTVGDISTCARPNRPEVSLQLDPTQGTVTIDLARLVEGLTLASSAGCQATPDDADCAMVMEALGLDPADGSAIGTPPIFGAR